MFTNPTYPVFPAFALFGTIVSLIPLPWHLESWNAGTCLYMLWTAVACLNQFINSIVWRNDAIDRAPIWCDISSRIIVGQAVGIPAAGLCISRRLYNISCVQSVNITRAEKRRAVVLDLLTGLLFPLICIALEYVVQGHRYNIIEQIGCFPAVYNTLPAYFLVSIWPILIGLSSAMYCGLSIRSFVKRQLRMKEFFAANKSMIAHRYLRLMALASTEILCTTPLAAVSIYLNATTSPVEPWISWSDTHYNFSRVDQVPAIIWRNSHMSVVSLELTRWIVVVCAFIFFGFFGFAEEARKNYCLAFWFMVKPLGIRPSKTRIGTATSSTKPPNPRNMTSTAGSLPVFISRPKIDSKAPTFSSCDEKALCSSATTAPKITVTFPAHFSDANSTLSTRVSCDDHYPNTPHTGTLTIIPDDSFIVPHPDDAA